MPLLFSKRSTAPYTLTGDRDTDIAKDQWPTFVCRAYSSEEETVVGELLDRANKAKEKSESRPALVESLKITLSGWKNMPAGFPEYTPEAVGKLGSLLEHGELWELAQGAAFAVRLQEEDRKKSASPSEPGTVASATAPTAGPVEQLPAK